MSKRQNFDKKTMLAAFERAGGKCENCGVKLRPGVGINYDHINPDYFDGGNSLKNCQCLCKNCHGAKTSEKDIPDIAKSRRLELARAGINRKPRGRPMDGTVASGMRRKFDGTVERR